MSTSTGAQLLIASRIEVPEWTRDDVIATLSRLSEVGDALNESEDLCAMFEEGGTVPDDADFGELRTKNFVLQKVLQVFNKLLIAKKRKMYASFEESKDGDQNAYEGVKRVIGDVQAMLSRLYKTYDLIRQRLQNKRREETNGFSVTLGELMGLEVAVEPEDE